ncbi:MAG: hypothetical protein AAF558_02375 [Verrucomicrobiota bacterium]
MNPLTPPPKGEKPREPGITCPKCKFFIQMAIQDLLTQSVFVCPGCGLKLNLDRGASRGSLQALQQLNVALKNLESVKNGFHNGKPNTPPNKP